MKNLLYLSFLFFSFLSFGQPTYKITEGEVTLLHPNYGIVILKDNSHYRLQITRDSYHKKQKEITLQSIEESKVKELYTSEKSIFYKDIDQNYDFKKLKELSFLYTYDDKEDIKSKNYDSYKFCQFSQSFFAIFRDRYDDKYIYTNVEEILPYMFIEFGNKKIIYTYYGDDFYLIPVQDKLKVFEFYGDYLHFHKTKKLKLSNKEIYEFSQHAFYDLKDDFFVVDTLPDKKVQLENSYDEVLIKQSYDSIILNPIIKCYNGGKIDVYNLRYKKLNKYPLKVSKDGLGYMQILGRNKVKLIDWKGKQIKKPLGYAYLTLPEAVQSEYDYAIEIVKKDTGFVFKVRNLIYGKEYEKYTTTDTSKLINTKGIWQFYFKTNVTKDTISKRNGFYNDIYKAKITDVVDFSYNVVYFKKEDRTFGMKYLGNFLKNNHDFNIEYTEFKDFNEYQNLQFIKYKYPFYKMKKNNLYMLFPLQKEFRYKKLKDFKGNFARFTLPNGQKGWLDMNGNEYLDD